MAYYFESDSKNRIARCRFEGRVTDDELRGCYRLASQIVAGGDLRGGVFDVSSITSLKVSSSTILELANYPPIIANSEIPRVIVAEPLHIYGLARMFGLAGQYLRPNLHVVRHCEHAWAILSVTNPEFKPYEVSSEDFASSQAQS